VTEATHWDATKTSDQGVTATLPAVQRSSYRQLRPGPGTKREEVLANQRSRLIAATIELVADRGYDGTRVSNIVQLAGVSKASFYEQFAGKDECFTAVCDTALRAAATAVLRGESRGGEGRDRIRAGLTALAELMAAQPKATRLVLIDAVASTPAIREHLSERFGLFEALVHDRLASTGPAKLPRHLIAGLVRGIAHHARRCVGAGCPERFRELVDPLLDWGLGFSCEEASAAWRATATSVRPAVEVRGSRAGYNGARAPKDTQDLLMAGALRLASREGFAALTPSRIRRAAGVSRRSFDVSFDDAAGCFLAAVEAELHALFTRSKEQAGAETSWTRKTALVLDRFTCSLADAPDLSRLAFVETLEAAPASLVWRESLIATWAAAIYHDAPASSRPAPAAAEAAVAAIWGFVADLVATHRLHLLPAQTSRLTFFALTPTLTTGDMNDSP
jgi:AcrR family transcriptional regulator